MNLKPTVYIVDKDAAVRDSLKSLLCRLDIEIKLFERADEFLRTTFDSTKCCLITELYLPDMNGIKLLDELRTRGINMPTIVLASESDVATAVRIMRAGAVDFIDKPIIDQQLLNRVRQVLAKQT